MNKILHDEIMSQSDIDNNQAIPDVQSSEDTRRIPINKVGIRDVKFPLTVKSAGKLQATVGEYSMYVGLPHDVKGTHMSRFLEILESHVSPLSPETFPLLLTAVKEKLEAETAYITVKFPYFIHKAAPVSGIKSMMDYSVTLSGSIIGDEVSITTSVLVPVTSLCPCSKKISDYGAHNQRSHVIISVETDSEVSIEEIAAIGEAEASCELFGILKRPDEKYVTERAYENPKFVEDLLRDIAARLDADDRVTAYKVSSENFESIHNHSAYAETQKRK
jgi:GTP cyclohydrolase I